MAIIIIGGTSAIGLSLIERFARSGENILFTYNKRVELAKATEKTISKEYNVFAKSYKVDVTNEKDVTSFKEAITDHKINAIVFNSGIIKDKPFYKMTHDDFDLVVKTNLYGCFNIMKVFIRDISLNQGSIVIVSSISGLIPKEGQVNYSCSKSALIAMTRNLAKEYSRFGVRVNAVAPGIIETEMTNSLDPKYLEKRLKSIPLKRYGKPSEISSLIHYLVLGDCNYITGQTIVVDGGIHMS